MYSHIRCHNVYYVPAGAGADLFMKQSVTSRMNNICSPITHVGTQSECFYTTSSMSRSERCVSSFESRFISCRSLRTLSTPQARISAPKKFVNARLRPSFTKMRPWPLVAPLIATLARSRRSYVVLVIPVVTLGIQHDDHANLPLCLW